MKLVKTAFAIALAIIFVIFIAYGLYVVYEPPKYEADKSDCINCYNLTEKCAVPINDTSKRDPNCFSKVYDSEEYQQCMQEYDACKDAYKKTTERYKNARNSFYILLAIGLITIVVGVLIKKDAIGSGLIGGGVLVIIWSLIYTAEYWLQLNKYVKLSALGIVLVVLIYLGYKKIEKRIK